MAKATPSHSFLAYGKQTIEQDDIDAVVNALTENHYFALKASLVIRAREFLQIIIAHFSMWCQRAASDSYAKRNIPWLVFQVIFRFDCNDDDGDGACNYTRKYE